MDDFKFAAIDITNQKVLIGHADPQRGWVTDTAVSATLAANTDYTLSIILRGTSVSVSLNGALMTSTSFNAVVVDGAFGVFGRTTASTFDTFRARSDSASFVAAPPRVFVSDTTVTEGDGGTSSVIVTLTLSAPVATATSVSFTTANGTAIAGTDYTATSGIVTFAANTQSATITIPLVADFVYESDELFKVLLSNPTGLVFGDNAALITVLNDDPVPALVTIAASDAGGSETAPDSIVFVITRTTVLTSAITINLSWSGTATLTSDYSVSATGGTLAANAQSITLAAGVTTATLTITPVDDTAVEPTEGVTLTLAAGSGYTVGSPGAASGTITDNDVLPPALVTVSATDANGAEQALDPITFVITRTVTLSTAITIN